MPEKELLLDKLLKPEVMPCMIKKNCMPKYNVREKNIAREM